MHKILITLILLPLIVHSKTLVVSDIDDTIKVSHVLSSIDSVLNAYDTDNPMHGMSLLYQVVKTESKESYVAYVSNAPGKLMAGSHSKFLRRNQFPPGGLYLRNNISDNSHKLNTITNLIKSYQPDTVILIGDNGEQDPEIYNQVVTMNQFKNIKFLQFIRIDYDYESDGKKMFSGQIGFITSAEVALELFRHGIINNSIHLEKILSSSIQQVPSDNEDYDDELLYLPDWVTCSQHAPDLSDFYELSPKVGTLQKMIYQKCF